MFLLLPILGEDRKTGVKRLPFLVRLPPGGMGGVSRLQGRESSGGKKTDERNAFRGKIRRNRRFHSVAPGGGGEKK